MILPTYLRDTGTLVPPDREPRECEVCHESRWVLYWHGGNGLDDAWRCRFCLNIPLPDPVICRMTWELLANPVESACGTRSHADPQQGT